MQTEHLTITNRAMLCAVCLLSFAMPAWAVDVTLTDKNSTVTVDPDSALGAFSWTVDGLDNMSQQWLWFRLDTDDHEIPVDTLTLTSATAADNDTDEGNETLDVLFTGTDFTIRLGFVLAGGETGTAAAQLTETITITNTGTGRLDISVFQLNDFDIIGLFEDNTARIIGANLARITSPSGATAEITVSPTPDAFDAGLYDDLIEEFNDDLITNLTNEDGPETGDAAAAFQWDLRLAEGSAATITKTKVLNVPIVIDNTDVRTSQTGTWTISAMPNPLGPDSLFSRDPGAMFTFEAPITGLYKVSLWWTTSTARSTEVPIQIFDGETLLAEVTVNQRINGGVWNPLGNFTFSKRPTVKITSTGAGSTSADAVMFTAINEDETIVDNRDAMVSSTGTWPVSGGADPWAANSVYSKNAGDTFTFEAPVTGHHTVSMWWTQWPSRSNSVSVQILDGDTLLETVTVDQTTNVSQWNNLGSYSFNGTANVKIIATGNGTSTNADAVKFTRSTPPDIDHIEIIGPDTVGDDRSTDFDVKAFFTDNSSLLVEPQVWDVDSPTVNISATGLLMVGDVDNDTSVIITATYTVNDDDFVDTHEVTIIDGGVAAEIIIDNLDADATSTGTWLISGGADPHGTDSVYNKTTGDEFRFEANLASGTQYAVYMWWTTWPSRRTNLPVEIYSGNTLLDTVTVNQKINGGQWNLLGFYSFSDRAKVKITALSGFSTNADAVRFIPVSQLTEIIIDNGSPGTSSTGTWQISGGANPYGSSSLWSRTAGDTYSFEMQAPGTYTVYAWWTAWPSRSNAVTVEIYDGTMLKATVTVDQTANAGLWNQLGTGSYTFSGTPKVKIIATGNDTSTNADAVRFVPAN